MARAFAWNLNSNADDLASEREASFEWNGGPVLGRLMERAAHPSSGQICHRKSGRLSRPPKALARPPAQICCSRRAPVAPGRWSMAAGSRRPRRGEAENNTIAAHLLPDGRHSGPRGRRWEIEAGRRGERAPSIIIIMPAQDKCWPLEGKRAASSRLVAARPRGATGAAPQERAAAVSPGRRCRPV